MLMRKRRNTDYGQGRFDELGLFLFTTRNGSIAGLSNGKDIFYAEKIMITRENQLSSMHRHNIKAEDIINRGGDELIIELYAPDEDGGIDRESVVTVPSDATQMALEAGALAPDTGSKRHFDARNLARVLGGKRRLLCRRSINS
jgi:D-lyxose ketol-isomerase